MSRRHLVSAALAAALLVAPAARAQDADDAEKARKLPVRRAQLVVDSDWLAVTVSWRDVIDASIRKKLLSGLPTVIAARAYVFPAETQKAVALGAMTCHVVFDLWDEVFRITVRQGGLRRRMVAVNVEGVLRRCADARRLPVARRIVLGSGPHFLGVLVEVNPLSKEMLERIKRWVVLPRGTGAVGPGDSLFGSFVGLFVTQVPDADNSVAFRTQSFRVGDLEVIPPPR